MNIKDFDIKISYKVNGKLHTTICSDENLSFEDVGKDNEVKIILKTNKKVELVLAELVYDHYYQQSEMFLANGYQSWTATKEFKKGQNQTGLKPIAKIPIVKPFAYSSGDYNFAMYGKDLFHSFTYTYLRQDKECEFFGTLNDRTGYTIFYADMKQDVLAVVKDIEGLSVDGEYELFNIIYFKGSYDEVFDKYFDAYPQKKTNRVDHLAGYTSWYNYFQKIDEEIILRDIKGLEKVKEKANIFQIDDGYETMVGDWNIDKKKFPNGLKPIVDKIHKNKWLAGLWIAPFSAQFKANIVKEHPEWLIKKSNGKNFIGGFAWNGFYVLDIEQKPVREYIKNYFDKVFNEWGFDMVKLDFLYSACIVPRNNKTRGQLMYEAMDFLRECCGDKIILGCGVPLGPSFGVVDACRIGCDAELNFNDIFIKSIINNETISTKSAIKDTIFRRHLTKIFANDPDVFFLRDDGMNGVKMTMEQKKLLAKIYHMMGDVLFVSDNIGNYDKEKLDILTETYKKFDGKILSAQFLTEDKMGIEYEENGRKYLLTFSIATGENQTSEID